MADEQRIVLSPHGEPVIRGTRVHIRVLLGRLVAGQSPEEIIADYPVITVEDIEAALDYTKARMVRTRAALDSAQGRTPPKQRTAEALQETQDVKITRAQVLEIFKGMPVGLREAALQIEAHSGLNDFLTLDTVYAARNMLAAMAVHIDVELAKLRNKQPDITLERLAELIARPLPQKLKDIGSDTPNHGDGHGS